MTTLTAVDLFSGAGGTTQGLRDAGFAVVAAIEKDCTAAKTFALNHPDVKLYATAIEQVKASTLAEEVGRVDLLTACPPCQPFSTLGTGDADDPRNRLISSIPRFVEALEPRVVVIENVPGVQREPRFRRLLAFLKGRYDIAEYVVQASDLGIPQRRRRLIVLAVASALDVTMPTTLVEALPADFDVSATLAGEVLTRVSTLTELEDPVHRARDLKPTTLERIRAVPQGGGRLDLPAHLQLECHKRLTSRNATSVYGRIDANLPAPTMTTRCTTPSCGRFVHPVLDRGLTLREAALLQTFPIGYAFTGHYGDIERMIGNAVPPRLSEALGRIAAHWLMPEASLLA